MGPKFAAQILIDCAQRNHGGADRIRTDDRLRAKQVLFQLSYDPQK